MNEIKLFHNDESGLDLRTILNDDGSISVNAEDVAFGLGFVQIKNGKLYARWDRVNSYLLDLEFPQQVGKDDFIPETAFYLLAMKGETDAAKAFQLWVAKDVLPQIRKTGSYGHAIDTKDSIRLLKEIRPMAKLKPQMYVDAVQEILRKTGIDVKSSKSKSITVDNSIDEFIRGYKTLDGHTSSEVYNEYLAYCVKHDVHAVTHIHFTKHLKQHHGVEVIFKKLNGKTVRMYSKA